MFKYSHVFTTLQWTVCVRGKRMCTYLCMCALIITQSKKKNTIKTGTISFLLYFSLKSPYISDIFLIRLGWVVYKQNGKDKITIVLVEAYY